MPFYLARWVQGDDFVNPGSTLDYVAGAELSASSWAIDLRPPDQLDGFALFRTSDDLPVSPRRLKLTDDPDDTSQAIRTRIANRLGIDVPSAVNFRRLIFGLIMQGDDNHPTRWNALRPSRGRYEVWLGELLHSIPVVGGGALSDPFTRSDSTDISTGAPFSWTELSGNFEISTNRLRVVTGASASTGHHARAESDLASTDMYAQVEAVVANTSDRIGPQVRHNATAADQSGYTFYGRTNATSTYQLSRFNATGGVTTITSVNASGIGVPSVLRLEANGSSFTGYDDGVSVITGTDTVLTGTRLRTGIYMLNGALNGQPTADNFAAGELSVAPQSQTVSPIVLTFSALGSALPGAISQSVSPLTPTLTIPTTPAVPGAVSLGVTPTGIALDALGTTTPGPVSVPVDVSSLGLLVVGSLSPGPVSTVVSPLDVALSLLGTVVPGVLSYTVPPLVLDALALGTASPGPVTVLVASADLVLTTTGLVTPGAIEQSLAPVDTSVLALGSILPGAVNRSIDPIDLLGSVPVVIGSIGGTNFVLVPASLDLVPDGSLNPGGLQQIVNVADLLIDADGLLTPVGRNWVIDPAVLSLTLPNDLAVLIERILGATDITWRFGTPVRVYTTNGVAMYRLYLSVPTVNPATRVGPLEHQPALNVL